MSYSYFYSYSEFCKISIQVVLTIVHSKHKGNYARQSMRIAIYCYFNADLMVNVEK